MLLIESNRRSGLRRRLIVFSPPVMDYRYFPGRGIMYSLLVHEIVLFGLLAVSAWSGLKERPRRPELVGVINLRERRDIIYFPVPGRGSEPVPSSKGFSYPGP